MSLFDTRTVILTYTISNLICLVVIAALWKQHRRRFAGLGFWLADFFLQFVSLALVALRGTIPDFLSMTGSNAMVIGGTILLYIGLEHFTGKRGRQIHNYVFLMIFIIAHAYFVSVFPSLPIRNLLFSLGLLFVCTQCAWLMLRRADPKERSSTVGAVFVAFSLVSIGRIVTTLFTPSENDFFRSSAYDTTILVTYQMLFIVLTFSLFLLVNHHLLTDLKNDIAARSLVEKALTARVKELCCIYDLSGLIHAPGIAIDDILHGSVYLLSKAMQYPELACAQLVIEGQSYATENYQDSARKLSCDILRNGQTVGILEVCYREDLPQTAGNIFLEEESKLLKDVAERLGQVWEGWRTAAALQKSEERYQVFVSQSFEAIYRTEFDQPIDISLPIETQINLIYENAYMAECNQALADMYGLPSPEAMIGMRLLGAHGGSNNPINRAAFRKFIEAGYKSTSDETMELDAQGHPVWFLSNTIGIVENGFLVRLWGTSITITERKRAEEEQRRLSRRNQAILEAAGEGIYGTDDSGKITFINPTAAKMLGWMAEDLIGQENHRIMHHSRPDGSVYPREVCPILSTTRDGLVHQGEEFFWRLDGKGIPVEFTSTPVVENGVLTGCVVTFSDISDRKRAEDALKESESWFRSLFEQSADAILFLENGIFTDCNQATVEMMHAGDKAQFLSLHPSILSPQVQPDGRLSSEKADEMIRIALERGSNRFEWIHRRVDGIDFPVEVLLTPMTVGDRRVIHTVWRDITTRKRVAAALHRQNEILAALQETTIELLSQLTLDTLLEKIVHRAGQLLGTSAGYLDLLDSETDQLIPHVGLGALAESLDHMAHPGEGVAGTVWQTGTPLIVDDYDQWPGRIGSFSKSTIRSIVGVPLLSRGKVIGVLGLAHEAASERAFTEEDVELLTQFARLVAIGIENAWLYHAAQQELAARKRSDTIIQLRLRLWEFSTSHSVEALMQKALDEIEGLTGSSIGFYHFVEEDQNTLTLQAWSTRTRNEFCQAEGEGMHYPIEQAGVWVDCVRQKKAIIHNDYASLPHRKGMPPGHAEVIRELIVPILRNGLVVSILGVGNKPSDYNEKDIEIVTYIADLVWTVVAQKRAEEQIRKLNKQLEHLAMTDDLTGLANRRAFFLLGNEELKKTRRYHTPLTLIMLDIDKFKHINDTYGHEAGDAALQNLARTLQGKSREVDIVARLGGEEFGVLLPNTKATDALVMAERLRQAIEQEDFSVHAGNLRITASIGVAAYGEEIPNLDILLRNADVAMYQAKNQGRNRVVYLE